MIDPHHIIRRFFPEGTAARHILITHAEQVAEKALAIADRLPDAGIDREFVRNGALLHDIGIFATHVPKLHCFGTEPYVRHGIIGKELLDGLGLPALGRVCETHVGVGITKADVVAQRLPLPERDMVPETIEEIIVCYADKFFSKSPNGRAPEKPVAKIRMGLLTNGPDKAEKFQEWVERFGV